MSDQFTEMFGEVELRWYQIAAKNQAIDLIRQGNRRVLICKPTGTGKTITIASTLNCPSMKEALGITEDRPLRVLLVAHLQRLLTQAERTFANSSGVELELFTPKTSIPYDKVEWCDIVVIDEAHHEAMMSVQFQLDKFADKVIIGLTATKDRSDGMVIKFDSIIEPLSREEAVEQGYLSELNIWSFIDYGNIEKVDYINNIITQYGDIMGGTIVFVRTKNEARAVHNKFVELGYNSVFVDNQSAQELDEILDDFSTGVYDKLVCCNKLGEGVDVKGCKSVIIGRNITSYPLLNQMVGRASRPDSECQVFELINPLTSSANITATVLGTPAQHKLCSPQSDGSFKESEIHYTSTYIQGYITGKK